MAKNGFFLLFSLCFALFCFGCRSVSVENFVDPLDLIDSESSFYLRIPKNVDSDLISRMLQNNIQGISEKDAYRITERIDTVYLGLKKSRKSVEFQISSLCSFPKIAVGSAFSKKNGWSTDKLVLENSAKKNETYTIYKNSGILASFPSVNIALLGRNVPSMVEKYHNISNGINTDFTFALAEDLHDWLSSDDRSSANQVRFYASKPQSFLTTLTGANLNLKLAYVKGFLVNDADDARQYLASLEFEFKDSRVVGAAKAMLEVVFGLTDSNVTVTSNTHLIVSDVKINKTQLYKILVI